MCSTLYFNFLLEMSRLFGVGWSRVGLGEGGQHESARCPSGTFHVIWKDATSS